MRDGVNQALVVTLGLIGVRTGETAQRDVKLVRRANVSRDHGGPAGPCVPLGQQPTTDPGVVSQASASRESTEMVPFMLRN